MAGRVERKDRRVESIGWSGGKKEDKSKIRDRSDWKKGGEREREREERWSTPERKSDEIELAEIDDLHIFEILLKLEGEEIREL